MVVLSLGIMAVLSPLLTVVSLVVVPVILWIAVRLRNTVFPASWDAQQRAAEVAGVVDEAVSGVRVVKGFGQEQRELARLAAASEDLFGSRLRALRIQARYGSTLQAVPALGQVAVLAFGGWLAIEGRISLGTFLAFSTYLFQMVGPVRMLSVAHRRRPAGPGRRRADLRAARLHAGGRRATRRHRRCPPSPAGSPSTTSPSATCARSPSSATSP